MPCRSQSQAAVFRAGQSPEGVDPLSESIHKMSALHGKLNIARQQSADERDDAHALSMTGPLRASEEATADAEVRLTLHSRTRVATHVMTC